MITSDGYSVPNSCFNPSLIEPINSLCESRNNYLAKIPVGYIPSFIDLKGNYSENQENFVTIIISALQRMGINGKGKENELFDTKIAFSFYLVSSVLTELRFGLDMSLITRVYYIIFPYQLITQEQIQDQLKVCFYFNDFFLSIL